MNNKDLLNKYKNILPHLSNNKKNYLNIVTYLNSTINDIKKSFPDKPTEQKIAAVYVTMKIYVNYTNIISPSIKKPYIDFFNYFDENFDNYKNNQYIISDEFIMKLQFYKLFIKSYIENNS